MRSYFKTHNIRSDVRDVIKTLFKIAYSAVFIPELKAVHISSDAGRFL